MCSYNAVNGVPSCANDLINNKITRDEWGFDGYIVSDCGAVSNILNSHHYTKTAEDTVKVALRGGCDLDCGGFYQQHAQSAYSKGTINDTDLNLAMTRLFKYRMRLGMFDPPSSQPYVTQYTADIVNTPANQDLALNVARESIVLLQNDGILPLDISKKQSIAIVGPNGNATNTMQGNYKGTAPYLISPLMGLQKMGVSVTYAEGCDVSCGSTKGFSEALNIAKSADIVIAVVGLDGGQESEGHDRSSIDLPGNQGQLLQQLHQQNTSKSFIVVLMSGGPVDISEAKSFSNAVLWTGYPGQSGGTALGEILYGITNPSGRLPMTFYPADYVNQISYGDMSMRTTPGRTYKFYTGKPVFSFGDGLSYTTFTMEWMSSFKNMVFTSEQLKQLGDIKYEVKVTNTGELGGSVPVLAYVTSNVPGAPQKELFGFQKVYLEPGKSANLFFSTTPEVFSTVDVKGNREVKRGEFMVQIGQLKDIVFIK